MGGTNQAENDRQQKDACGGAWQIDDRTKVDEYLDSVRAIERRIQVAERQADRELPKLQVPDAVPVEYLEHVRLLTDLLVLGLQTDSTRVATFMYNNEAGRRAWPELGIREGHHELAHLDPRSQEGKEKLEKLKKIDRCYLEQFVYLVQKLKGVREGEGTLLDNTMLMFASGMSNGNRHAIEDLPVLVAGHGGGTLRTGRYVDYNWKRMTPLSNLYVEMLNRVGVKTQRFGDSTGGLPNLA